MYLHYSHRAHPRRGTTLEADGGARWLTMHRHGLMPRNRHEQTLGEDGRRWLLSVDSELRPRAHSGRNHAPGDWPILV